LNKDGDFPLFFYIKMVVIEDIIKQCCVCHVYGTHKINYNVVFIPKQEDKKYISHGYCSVCLDDLLKETRIYQNDKK
jgi:hypothetical protein